MLPDWGGPVSLPTLARSLQRTLPGPAERLAAYYVRQAQDSWEDSSEDHEEVVYMVLYGMIGFCRMSTSLRQGFCGRYWALRVGSE